MRTAKMAVLRSAASVGNEKWPVTDVNAVVSKCGVGFDLGQAESL